MEYKRVKATRRRLRDLGLSEKWLQDQIADDPSLLGLGEEVRVYKKEFVQPSGGRIDFVLADGEEQHYEVEIMLGATDPSHIIRTIEYWDVERNHYKQKEHCAVLVAEEITSRFFNVIALLNRAIPIIAIKLDTLLVDDKIVLHFTKVLDASPSDGDEDDTATDSEPTDVAFWEKRSNPQALEVARQIIAMVPEARRKVTYNKYQIAVATDGKQFVWLCPMAKQPQCVAKFAVRETDAEHDRAWWVQTLGAKSITAKLGRTKLIVHLTRRELVDTDAEIRELIQTCEAASH